MKTAFITATLVATSNAAKVTCDWKPDTAGTGWAAGLECPDNYDCCSPGTGFAAGDKGKLAEACVSALLSMSGPTPDKWGTNSPANAVCCSRGSGYKDSENACNIGLGKGYAGKDGMAKPKTCPTGSTKCGGDACIKIAAGKYCLRDDGGDSSKDKLVDNTCDAWYGMSKESKGCGAIKWTDETAPTGSCSKTRDDCKYTSYKVGAFTDAAKSTNKDAKMICYGVTYIGADGKAHEYAPDEDKKLKIEAFGESKSAPEGGDALQCLAPGLFSDADTSWKGCIAPDTTKQGCPGLAYGDAAKKQFYPDDACLCNSYDATAAASSATSAALSASAIIGSVGLLALL